MVLENFESLCFVDIVNQLDQPLFSVDELSILDDFLFIFMFYLFSGMIDLSIRAGFSDRWN